MQLAHVCLSIEGGPRVASEARAALRRGVKVVPLMCTGGASEGLYDFPSHALEKPDVATQEQWNALGAMGPPRATSEVIAAAAAAVVLGHVRMLTEDPAFIASHCQALDADEEMDLNTACGLSSDEGGFDGYRSMPSWSYRPYSCSQRGSSDAATERAPDRVSIDDAGLSWEFARAGNIARPVVPRLDLARVKGAHHRAKSETRSAFRRCSGWMHGFGLAGESEEPQATTPSLLPRLPQCCF